MKIFVTGANGFLGRAVCRILRREHDIVGVGSRDADLRRQDALSAFDSVSFDRIYHLAAWTQPGDFAKLHKGQQFLVNQQIDLTVLSWWSRYQPQAKLISIGTSAAYAPDQDAREENYLSGSPVPDLYFYAMAKRILLLGQRALHEQYSLRYLTVVPSALYGAGYPVLTKRLNFVLDIAWKILSHKHHGTPVVLWGDGTQRREAVFVDDFVSATAALDAIVDNDIINIGAGVAYTIDEFARLLCDLTGVDPTVLQYDTSRFVGAQSKTLNNEKLDRLLPRRCFVPLKEGLAAVIDDLEPLVQSRRPQ